MILAFDTSECGMLRILLASRRGEVRKFRIRSREFHSETLLLEISRLLKKEKVSLSRLSRIVVVRGPGKFSSLRVGITCANALAWSLNISAVGITKGEFDSISAGKNILNAAGFSKKFHIVTPEYGKEPNITRPQTPIFLG